MVYRIRRADERERLEGYRVLASADDLAWLERFLREAKGPIVVDTETWKCDVGEEHPMGKARATCVTLAHADHPNLYLDNWGEHEGNLRVLKEWLLREDVERVLHNGIYDRHVFANHGLEMRGGWDDTLVMDYLIDTSAVGQHRLETCLKRWFGEEHEDYATAFSYHPLNKDGSLSKRTLLRPHHEWWERGERARVVRYACKDTREGLRLYHHHRARLEATPWRRDGRTMWDYYRTFERPFADVLWRMERRGIAVDTAVLERLRTEFTALVNRHGQDFFAGLVAAGVPTRLLESGFGTIKRKTGLGEPFNPDSPPQLARVLYEVLGLACPKTTDTGRPSVDSEVLEGLAAELPCLGSLLDQREVQKLLGTYVEPLLRWSGEYGGRVHCHFNPVGTVTGRISASKPNLTNVPTRTDLGAKLRTAFVAAPGKKLVVLDLASIEPRVLAHRSQDARMLEFMREDGDMHSLTLYYVLDDTGHGDIRAEVDARFGGPTREALAWLKATHPKLRAKAKTLGLGIQYGSGAAKAGSIFGVDREAGAAAIRRYEEAWPGVARYKADQVQFARAHGYIKSLLGRRLHQPNARSPVRALRAAAERQIGNHGIQGGAADVIKLAMLLVETDDELRDCGAEMLLQVHDELVFEAPAETAAYVEARAKELMQDPYTAFGLTGLTVPTVAEGGVGDNWADAKK